MKICSVVLLIVSLASVLSCVQKAESRAKVNLQNADEKAIEESFSRESESLPKMENPHLVVKKSQRKLEVFDGEKLIKTYSVALGFAPVGDKQKQGDGKTPEGDFYIFTRNDKSKFYLSLGVSYPNVEDAERGLQAKLITKTEYDKIVRAVKDRKKPPQNTRLGGEIYIHGGGSSGDWTWGCVALKNEEIKELFDAIPVGARVKIQP